MKLPSPRAQLAGCVWLPRIIAKARLANAGLLPPDYAARFAHPSGVDGRFLSHFDLKKEALLTVCAHDDAKIAAWFTGLPSTDADRIDQWNRIAVNLGRAGYPMADRLPVALSTTYAHLAGRGPETVFEVLEADEAAPKA